MSNVGLRGKSARTTAVAALVLAIVLALGIAFWQAPAAYAEPEQNVSFQVSTDKVDGNGSEVDVTVNAYKLFEADVNTSDVAANATWNSTYQSKVMEFLAKGTADTHGTTTYGAWLYAQQLVSRDLTGVATTSMTAADKAQYEKADNALAFISEEIKASAGLMLPSGLLATRDNTFSTELAKVVKGAGGPDATQTAKKSTPASFTLVEGFYLFSDGDGASAPVWAPVGGSQVGAALKDVEILTVTKQVEDIQADGSKVWGKVTDVGAGDTVNFKLTGTLPTSAKSGWFYEFEDTVPAGLNADATTVKVNAVKSDGTKTDVTSHFNATLSGTTLKVACEDLYNSSGADSGGAISNASTIELTYSATMNTSATIGTGSGAGQGYNTNSAVLRYGIRSTGELTTTPDTANVATYELDLLKVDADVATKVLEGAEFSIMTTPGSFLQADGSIGSTEYIFKTDSAGKIAIPRIDTGVYQVTEKTAPDGYELPSPATARVDISSTKDQTTGDVTALVVVVNNGAPATADIVSGIVEVTFSNEASIVLPITGMTPSQLGTIIGVLLVAAGAVILVVRSRRAKREQA